MGATFTMVARYAVSATCQSPIRTGGTRTTTEQLLTDAKGCAYLQGSSLAGALRAYHRAVFGIEANEALFGSQRRGAGHLVISDGYFTCTQPWETRPRLRINARMGTAEQGGKFDLTHLPVGTTMEFSLTWLGQQEDQGELAQVEQLLAALHQGVIRLGAQKTNGFGRVSLTVRRQLYDMQQERDRTSWLQETDLAEPFPLPAVAQPRQICFQVQGQADNLLVKSGRAERRESKNITVPLQEQGKPILPGSSVKGVLRSRVASIAHILGRDGAEELLFGRGSAETDNGVGGQVVVDDVRLSGERRQTISRIRINRFTGGVMRGGLFTEEAVSSPVTLKLSVPETCQGYCSYLVYALRDLGLGLYQLGSGGSIGRGFVKVEQITVTMPDGRVGVMHFDQNRRCKLEDPQGVWEELCRGEQGGEL